ncbi:MULTISPECIES: HipA family kinase [unclassified Sphingomonas]|uniref:HipA family kinase n=1 Tax=unclassified Sphingomonas TaxID=196159 RepID=UPI0012E13D66|nr:MULTISPECIES: HipA family kinase [unclassified Sphingomonas]
MELYKLPKNGAGLAAKQMRRLPLPPMDDNDEAPTESADNSAPQDALPAAAVQYGVVLEGAEPFKFNENVNPTWRGQVLLNDGSIARAFIKDIPLRELANEVLAAAIGLRLGLPIPTPIVARAAKADLPATNIRLQDTEDHIVFASTAMPAGPVLQMIRDASDSLLPEIMSRVTKWDGLGTLYGFDTWIANIDRHRGNFLFGSADEVWLIDHGYSFTGPGWTPSDLRPEVSYTNRLADWVTPYLTQARKSELVVQAAGAPATISQPTLGGIVRANSVDRLLGNDLPALISFLRERVPYVPKQSTDALGLLI